MNHGDSNKNKHQKFNKKVNQHNIGFQVKFNNKNSLIKCTYDIKDLNETQIINNRYENYINEDIKSKIKILNNNKKEKLIYKKRFNKLGINVVYFIIEENLKNMNFMFYNCSTLKKIEFLSVSTQEVVVWDLCLMDVAS